jgi:pyruvate dehydrogenase E2 component (dihydrolipoamide acetyltransferase)
MAVEIVMPKFGFSMEEGILASWLVEEGDEVARGDAVAEIESEKLVNNAVADSDGIVAKLLIEEGDEAPCGTPICIVATVGEDIEAALAQLDAAPEVVEEVIETKVEQLEVQEKTAPVKPDGEVKIAPKAKKYADEKGLSYDHIVGTGRLGMISIDDLKKEGKPAGQNELSSFPVSGDDEVLKLSTMRKTIASAMEQSLQNTAQLTTFMEGQVGPMVQLYKNLKEKYQASGVKLSYTAMIIKAVATALEEHDNMRLQLIDGKQLIRKASVDIGVAVDIPDGLVVPVIRQANLKDLRTICLELADLSHRARTGALTETDMGNACMSISNLGAFGITNFTPILNTPESAILGTGAIVDRPVIKDGGVHIEPVLNLSLTYDHRVVDGAPAARFMKSIVTNLSNLNTL